MQRRLILSLILAALALPLRAGEERDRADIMALNAGQITGLLSGNTISGTWAGTGYKQYFSEGGLTVYVPESGRADQGRWRTNAESGTYESWWRMSGWGGYAVVMTNQGYAWVNGGTLEPFRVLPGKQVDW